MSQRLKSPGLIVLIIFLCVFSVRISSSDNYWVRVTNATDYYLHVIINSQSFLYVAPDDFARESFPTRNIKIKVFYSPGQDMKGKAERQFEAGGSPGPSCDNNIFCNEGPPLNVHWNVKPEDLTEHEPE